MVRRLVSISAIIIGLVHGRFLIVLLADTWSYGGSLGTLAVPAYSFLSSLIAYGVLGLFDLNKTKSGKVSLWTATIISTLTLLIGGIYMRIGEYFIAGIIFMGVTTLPFMIKKNPNLNAITLTINILTIIVAPFSIVTL